MPAYNNVYENIALVRCCIVVLVSYFSFGVCDRTEQVAKAIRSSFGFSS
jgi:hypothetical protein